MDAHKPLSEQVAVVTGASSGIGLATARMAAERGARVFLAARSSDGSAPVKLDGFEVRVSAVLVLAGMSGAEPMKASMFTDPQKAFTRGRPHSSHPGDLRYAWS